MEPVLYSVGSGPDWNTIWQVVSNPISSLLLFLVTEVSLEVSQQIFPNEQRRQLQSWNFLPQSIDMFDQWNQTSQNITSQNTSMPSASPTAAPLPASSVFAVRGTSPKTILGYNCIPFGPQANQVCIHVSLTLSR